MPEVNLQKESKRKTSKNKSSHGKSDVLITEVMKNQGKRVSQAMIYFWPRQKKTYHERNDKKQSEKAQVRKSS